MENDFAHSQQGLLDVRGELDKKKGEGTKTKNTAAKPYSMVLYELMSL